MQRVLDAFPDRAASALVLDHHDLAHLATRKVSCRPGLIALGDAGGTGVPAGGADVRDGHPPSTSDLADVGGAATESAPMSRPATRRATDAPPDKRPTHQVPAPRSATSAVNDRAGADTERADAMRPGPGAWRTAYATPFWADMVTGALAGTDLPQCPIGCETQGAVAVSPEGAPPAVSAEPVEHRAAVLDTAAEPAAVTAAGPEAAGGRDLVIVELGCQTVQSGFGVLVASLLAPDGILAVVTHSAPVGGQLVDPTASVVASAQNADLLYLQHIVIAGHLQTTRAPHLGGSGRADATGGDLDYDAAYRAGDGAAARPGADARATDPTHVDVSLFARPAQHPAHPAVTVIDRLGGCA